MIARVKEKDEDPCIDNKDIAHSLRDRLECIELREDDWVWNHGESEDY